MPKSTAQLDHILSHSEQNSLAHPTQILLPLLQTRIELTLPLRLLHTPSSLLSRQQIVSPHRSTINAI